LRENLGDFMGYPFDFSVGAGEVRRFDFAAGENQRIRNRDASTAPVVGSIGSRTGRLSTQKAGPKKQEPEVWQKQTPPSERAKLLP
jgi:hypothetical protein